ncbi:MAG: hypothetical protein LJF30_13915 [Acidobacteria bacterium]|nr:hypothetical protein [Acidobacteriota bacterium]
MAFLVKKFDRIDLRFEEMEDRLSARLTKVEVGQEVLRNDVHLLAEVVAANGRRIEANGRAIQTVTEKVELNGVGIGAVRDRVAALEDHLRAV